MADEFPETLFELIYRRAPSDSDRARLRDVRAGLGLSDRDEIWPVLMTLDHYALANAAARREIVRAVDSLPGQVTAAVAGVEKAVAAKADQAIARAVEKAADRLAQTVVQRSQATADRISKRQFMTAASLGGIVALVCLGAGGVGGYLVTRSLLDTCTSEGFTSEEGRWCFMD